MAKSSERHGVCLVTGAASGIGRATAIRLAKQGWKLVLIDRHAEGLQALIAERSDVEMIGRAHDVADETAWAETEAEVRTLYGGLDAIVVNAGVSDSGQIADLSLEAWRRVLSVNLDGAFLTLRAGMRLLRDGGAAVVVSSASALKAEPGIAAYAASKAAVIQLSKVAAKEGAPRGVRVNAVLPGGVETPMWSGMDFFRDMVTDLGSEQAAFDAIARHGTPLARYAKAEEIADQIAFLLSPAAHSITGATLVADGGYTL